jgi:hypothetical protein
MPRVPGWHGTANEPARAGRIKLRSGHGVRKWHIGASGPADHTASFADPCHAGKPDAPAAIRG